jgi:hypothetical protein
MRCGHRLFVSGEEPTDNEDHTIITIAFLSILVGAALRWNANEAARLAAQSRDISAATSYKLSGGAR